MSRIPSLKRLVAVRLVTVLVTACSPLVLADEGGISFWLPGQFGALAAVPTKPGWSLPVIYYHVSADESADKAFPRGGRGRVTAGVDAKADLLFAGPTYTFAEPLLGGQAALSMVAAVGRSEVEVDATLTGPRGRTISTGVSDSLKGASDLYPLATLKWNQGVHNFMVYGMGNLPVGAYDPDRLVNLGLGHASMDAGGGYTYFDKKNEFSAVAGMTYNWENTDTDYQNGIDAHLDWSASHFVTEQTHLGLVGYFYHQVTGDDGSGAVLGDFKSRVSAVGPQAGHFFTVGKELWYTNLKGFYEFDANNRAEGWNLWLTMAIPLGGGE
ncbi:phenol degradation protein [Pseudomonas cavernicola]|uniref:Phenol degradation protein n=1 Tax=Pseudomonas cavernicola TaxID=2320866 RepID=A0A418XFB0_9PSED|nr:transporter [Pseudomonas cavernicola]RJG11068.1 phenol degradation protein [Pseudomonas cavernicola]